METSNQEYEKYQLARKKVKKIKGFYSHLFFYLVFNAIIIFINLKYSPKVLWFAWTTLSWGIGLFFHGIRVFGWFPFFGKDWEERKIQEFMKDEEKQKDKFQ
jgi:hypothetical protein